MVDEEAPADFCSCFILGFEETAPEPKPEPTESNPVVLAEAPDFAAASDAFLSDLPLGLGLGLGLEPGLGESPPDLGFRVCSLA